ncbi:MAG: 1,4-alpha-glucan branching protein GlgB [Pseudomonadota bacterium]
MPVGLSDFDSYLFGIGQHYELYEKLGAHPGVRDGVAGTYFAVWAPHARQVAVVGNFNGWNCAEHIMHRLENAGVHELWIPGVSPGEMYKYAVRGADGEMHMKCDPLGFAMELRPANASIVSDLNGYAWGDAQWVQGRAERPWCEAMNIYEVHPGSWKRIGTGEEERMFTWGELAQELVPYVADLGYTHIELMGVAEHPLDASWGYQVVGYYAPTARHGSPQDFMSFVDACHRAGVGVILDWVPAHFPRDAHGLARFDGTSLYEYADPRVGEHREWGTKVFDYGSPQVRNFLVANALFWLDRYHVDGLRVDAVASMLYLDYNREEGQWIRNKHGGRENLEAIEFLKELNETVSRYRPDALMIAEESTAFAGVTHGVDQGGLGFRFKWNMGWMNDTLRYMALDPVHRAANANLITFSMVYTYSENYLLALSHDEFVHGKRSLVSKMQGDAFWRLAQVRLYLGWQLAHPGKQLLFMGSEFGQEREWSEERSLDWHMLEQPGHRALLDYVRTLNQFYRAQPACWSMDADPRGFQWLVVDDHAHSVYAFAREADPERFANAPTLVFAFNFTPVERADYGLTVPVSGEYEIVLNSDAAAYGGSAPVGASTEAAIVHAAALRQEEGAATAQTPSFTADDGEAVPGVLRLNLPPLAMLVLQRRAAD